MLYPGVWVNIETAGFSSTSLQMQTPITAHLLVYVSSGHIIYFPLLAVGASPALKGREAAVVHSGMMAQWEFTLCGTGFLHLSLASVRAERCSVDDGG